jgi:multidrug resistance efflux pump
MVQLAPSGAELPKLRRDLVTSRQDGGVVVKDPVSGRFFRFGEAEDFIASQFNGATTVDVVRQRCQDRFGTDPAPGAVEGFLAALRRAGLLEAGDGPPGPRPGPRRWVRGSPLYFRLKAFDPDRLLDRLIGPVRFCFTPSFVVFLAAVILSGLAVSIVNGTEITRDLLDLYRPEMVLAAWFIIFAVTAAHEFAHSLTCKRFGGHVHEMGFLLIYFQLAFYCNVSDAWLFPEKSRRLWVTFAGPYFELFLWALAVLTWRVTEPGTWVSAAALVVVATSAFKLVINLNPLIKLDGYYLLCDLLGTPNLRARAFGYLRGRVARLWASRSRAVVEATPRERRIYLGYSLLAGGYSTWLLGYIAWALGSFLTERYQGTGLVVYAGLVAVAFQNPLRRAVSRPVTARAWRGAVRWMKRPLKILLPPAGLVALLFLVKMELTVSGHFAIAPHHNADARAVVDGIIAQVHVDEGQRVGIGAPIARLADRDYRAELRWIEAQIDETRARLKMLRAGPRREEIVLAYQAVETARTRGDHARRRYEEAERIQAARFAKARADVAKAGERLRYARSDLARFRTLFGADLISRRVFEEAEERAGVTERELEAAEAELGRVSANDLAEVRKDLAVAEKELDEAAGRMGLLEAGSRPEEIEATEAALVRLGGHRDHLREQIRLVDVRSPATGVVTTPKPKEKVGQYVKKGDLIVEVHALETVRAEIALPEGEIGEVRLGQYVVLKARAFPEKSFTGTVTAIAPVATKEEGESWRGKMVRVTTAIDNPDLLLKPDTTGNAKIYCGERRLVDLVTRRLVRYLRVEFWSWW